MSNRYVEVVFSNEFYDRFCEDCPDVFQEPDIHYESCPCDFDISDVSCRRRFDYEKMDKFLESINDEIEEYL